MVEARRRALGHGAALGIALVLPALLLAWCGYTRRWIGDDGFINLRVVSQLLAGNGFVFNAGERSEAVTSPGWVVLLWFVGALGVRLEDAAWVIGLGLSVLGLLLSGLAALVAYADAERRRHWFVPFGLLAYACLPPAWDYATSGLENGLGLTFLGGSAYLVALATQARPASRSAGLLAAFTLSFAPLVRPDYELLAAPLLGLLCLNVRGRWRRLGLAGLGMSAGLVSEVLRMGYFASLVPNTALAKQAFETRWGQGWHYLWNSVGLYWLLVPLAAVVLALPVSIGTVTDTNERKGRGLLPLCLFGGGLLHLTYVVRMGGDFMHGRLLLPGLFAVLSAAPVVGFSCSGRNWRQGLGVLLCATLYAWGVICALRLRVAAENELGIGDERGWHARMADDANPTRIEHYEAFYFHRDAVKHRRTLDKQCRAGGVDTVSLGSVSLGTVSTDCPRLLLTNKDDGILQDRKASTRLPLAEAAAPPGIVAVVATRPLGIAAAVLGLRVNLVDYYGLADPIAARLTLARRRRPGHEKSFDTAWQAARYAAPESTADERVRAARHALGCGVLAELVDATRKPLTMDRFLSNMSLAVTARGLQVPRDHLEAERAFCTVSGSKL